MPPDVNPVPASAAPAATLSDKDFLKCQAMCRKWDKNDDGVIDRVELGQALKDLFPGVTAHDVDNLLGAADLNGDGLISYHEFFTWLATAPEDKVSYDDFVLTQIMAGRNPTVAASAPETKSPPSKARGLDAREMSEGTSRFLQEFTNPCLERFTFADEREASKQESSAEVVKVIITDERDMNPLGRREVNKEMVKLCSLSTGGFVIQCAPPVVYPHPDSLAKILDELTKLSDVYRQVFSEFAKATVSSGSNAEMILQFVPFELQHDRMGYAHINLAACAWALTGLSLEVQQQLRSSQIKVLLHSTDIRTWSDILKEKIRICSSPLKILDGEGRLEERYAGDRWGWIRKENDPMSRIWRVKAFMQTQQSIASGYVLDTKKGPVTVKLNAVQKMVKGTRIQKGEPLTAAQRYESTAAGKTTSMVKAGPAVGVKDGSTVMEVAKALTQQGRKVVAVSAASAYHPGGGVSSGGRHALEEACCGMTSLFPSLISVESVPDKTGIKSHRQHIPSDAVIMSPNVEIFREGTDMGYGFVTDPVCLCGVVSVAMFNRNPSVKDAPLDSPSDPGKYVSETKLKFEAVMTAAIKLGAQDLVIPDAGCGVFRNDPAVVGGCLGDVMKKFQGHVDRLVLSVLGTGDREKAFCDACERAFRGDDPRDICPAGAACKQKADAAHVGRFAHPGFEPKQMEGETFMDACLRMLAEHPPQIQKPFCCYGAGCRIRKPEHLARYSHPAPEPAVVCPPATVRPSGDKPHLPPGDTSPAGEPGGPASPVIKKVECRFGEKCHNRKPEHLAAFAHPWLDGSETPEQMQHRKDTETAHQLLDLAKATKWKEVQALLHEKPHLVNLRPEVRGYGLLHWACAQVRHDVVEYLVVSAGADCKLLTNDRLTPAELLREVIVHSPAPTLQQRDRDEVLVAWLQKRAVGEKIALSYSSSPQHATGATGGYTGGADAAPIAEVESEKPGGVVMSVERSRSAAHLHGDYVELVQTHNGSPVYRRCASDGSKLYLFLAVVETADSASPTKSGWTIGSKVDGQALAYLGQSVRGTDPSARAYGESWKVLYDGKFTAFFIPDADMMVRKQAGVSRVSSPGGSGKAVMF